MLCVFNCEDYFFLMLLKKKSTLVLDIPWRIISVMTLFVKFKYIPDDYKTAYCPANQLSQ